MELGDYLRLLVKKKESMERQILALQAEMENTQREIEYLSSRKQLTTVCPLTILHEEEWEIIFKMLDSKKDLWSLWQASAQFQRIIEERLQLGKVDLLIEEIFPEIVPYLSKVDMYNCSMLSKKFRTLVALNWYLLGDYNWSPVDFTSTRRIRRFTRNSSQFSPSFFIGKSVAFDCVEDRKGQFWDPVAVDLLSQFGTFICRLNLQDFPDRSPLKYYQITFQCLGNLPNLQHLSIGWGVESENIDEANQLEIAEYCRTHSFPNHPHLRELRLYLGMPDFDDNEEPPTDFLLRAYSSQLRELSIHVGDLRLNLNLYFEKLVDLRLSFCSSILLEHLILKGSDFPVLKKLSVPYHPHYGVIGHYLKFVSELPRLRQLTIEPEPTSENKIQDFFWRSIPFEFENHLSEIIQHRNLQVLIIRVELVDKVLFKFLNSFPNLKRLTLTTSKQRETEEKLKLMRIGAEAEMDGASFIDHDKGQKMEVSRVWALLPKLEVVRLTERFTGFSVDVNKSNVNACYSPNNSNKSSNV